MSKTPAPKPGESPDQDQFLTVLSREDALARFESALFPRPIASEWRLLADALGSALAEDVTAPIDVPPFDRSNVDGFAVRSADLAAASEAAPVRAKLNDEVIACGVTPARPVLSGTATPIATGGPLPRGADAVVMVEHTQPCGGSAIEVRRAASPGQFVSYAGSDIARGEALLRAGTIIGSREIGMLAACGIAEVGKPGRMITGLPSQTARHSGLPGFSATPWAMIPGLPSRATMRWDKSPAPLEVPPESTSMSLTASALRIAASS